MRAFLLRALILLAALGLAQPAAAQSVFDLLTGVYGTDFMGETCETNPKSQSFSPDHSRIRLVWARPVPSYLDDTEIIELQGRVVAFDDDSISYLRDGETRSGPDGSPLLWTLRLIGEGRDYCITDSTLPPDTCIEIDRLCGFVLS